MLTDGLAKGLALRRVLRRQLQCSAGNAQGLRRNTDTATAKGFHCELESKTVFANAVLFGHLDVGKH